MQQSTKQELIFNYMNFHPTAVSHLIFNQGEMSSKQSTSTIWNKIIFILFKMPLFVTRVTRKELFARVPVSHATSATRDYIPQRHQQAQLQNQQADSEGGKVYGHSKLMAIIVLNQENSTGKGPSESTEATSAARKIHGAAHTQIGERCQQHLTIKKNIAIRH